MEKENLKRVSLLRIILILFISIIFLILSQLISISTKDLLIKIGVGEWFGLILSGILYALITFIATKFYIKKYVKLDLFKDRITSVKIKAIWVIFAIAMPVIVVFVMMQFPGKLVKLNNLSKDGINNIIAGIFFIGIGAGFAEEFVFRGLIFSAFEAKWNKYIAIFIPSIVFGMIHLIGSDYNLVNAVQIIVSGSLVGIFFSVVAYVSDSVWNSAIIHSVWNIFMIGGLINIANKSDNMSVYNYILDTKSFLITGGEFGIEASVISIFAYIIAILLACLTYRFKAKNI
ncbi:MAG: type II CAAX endopeptidase family protein [Peptostreptococcus sp.]|uniref:CPBP family intramembrane glutamic endopeptidase n=1 Tax=Peptostreptococcus sp. TaxID=1262 RepID=UPI002FC9C785